MTAGQIVVVAFDAINAYSIIYGLIDGKMLFGPWVIHRQESAAKFWGAIAVFLIAMLVATVFSFGPWGN